MAMGESPQAAVAKNPLFIVDLEASPNNFIVDDTLHPQCFALSNKYAYNLLYLSATESLVSDQKALAGFIAKAHQQEMMVFLLCGKPDWSYKHAYALKTVENLINYNEGHPAIQKFDGMLLNVQLHRLDQWAGEKEILLKKYSQLIEKTRQKLDSSGTHIPLSASLPADLLATYKTSVYAKLLDDVLPLEAPVNQLAINDSTVSIRSGLLQP